MTDEDLKELLELPRTKKEAISLNSNIFFTNKPCKNGHLCPRYTCSSTCLYCGNNIYLLKTDRLKLEKIAEENFQRHPKLATLPKTRELAREIGSKRFFTGIPCTKGHITFRLTSNGCCRKCSGENRKKHNKTKPIDRNKWEGIYDEFLTYPETRQEAQKIGSIYYFTGRECKEGHIDRRYTYSKLCVKCDNIKRQNKKRNDPVYRLNLSISGQVRDSLKRGKEGRSWREYMNFTIDELKEHLEKQFTPEMSWGNYGKYWHVDHVKPLSLCESFDEAWQLSNLQPLKAEDNLKKGNRYIGHPNNILEVNNNARKRRPNGLGYSDYRKKFDSPLEND